MSHSWLLHHPCDTTSRTDLWKILLLVIGLPQVNAAANKIPATKYFTNRVQSQSPFTCTKCEVLTTVMIKFQVFWDVNHVNRQTANDVLEKHTASICRLFLNWRQRKYAPLTCQYLFISRHNLYLHLCTLLYPHGLKNKVVSSDSLFVNLRVYFQN